MFYCQCTEEYFGDGNMCEIKSNSFDKFNGTSNFPGQTVNKLALYNIKLVHLYL